MKFKCTKPGLFSTFYKQDYMIWWRLKKKIIEFGKSLSIYWALKLRYSCSQSVHDLALFSEIMLLLSFSVSSLTNKSSFPSWCDIANLNPVSINLGAMVAVLVQNATTTIFPINKYFLTSTNICLISTVIFQYQQLYFNTNICFFNINNVFFNINNFLNISTSTILFQHQQLVFKINIFLFNTNIFFSISTIIY